MAGRSSKIIKNLWNLRNIRKRRRKRENEEQQEKEEYKDEKEGEVDSVVVGGEQEINHTESPADTHT